jgi:hypothetical protein
MQVAQLFVETLIDIDKNLYDNNRLSLCRIGPGEVRPGKIGSTSTDRTGHAGPSSAHVTRYDSAVLTHRVAQQPGTRGVVETRQSLRAKCSQRAYATLRSPDAETVRCIHHKGVELATTLRDMHKRLLAKNPHRSVDNLSILSKFSAYWPVRTRLARQGNVALSEWESPDESLYPVDGRGHSWRWTASRRVPAGRRRRRRSR